MFRSLLGYQYAYFRFIDYLVDNPFDFEILLIDNDNTKLTEKF